MRRPGLWLATVAFLTFFLGPFFWQVLTSVWPDGQLTQPLPTSLTFDNYVSVLWGRPFLQVMVNSLLAASLTTLFCMAVGASAAFALAKLEFRGRNLLLAAALAVSMFPPIATVSPLYLILRATGLRDTLVGLVPPYATFALPLTLWILTSF
ncbi:MAG TPA: carbohydrate ABC transporter permease, partial [Myxococcaceae bacterium]|nr:carbohydrate ABC transporter permease [Myxococcaceae bacterium]